MTLAPDDPRHGTQNGYGNYGCRCDACRKAGAEYAQRPHMVASRLRYVRKKGIRPMAEYLAEIEAPHGTETRYTSLRFKCRCEACTAAATKARKDRDARVGRRCQNCNTVIISRLSAGGKGLLCRTCYHRGRKLIHANGPVEEIVRLLREEQHGVS